MNEILPDGFLKLHSALGVAGLIIGELILYLRIFAIWNFSKLVQRVTFAMFLVFLGAVMYTVVEENAHIELIPVQLMPKGCNYTYTTEVPWIGILTILIWETICFTLLVVRALLAGFSSAPQILQRMLKDGAAYFACILFVSITDMIFIKTVSPYYRDMLIYPQLVLHNVLCTRLLLRLRGAYESLDNITLRSTIKFAAHGDSYAMRSKGEAGPSEVPAGAPSELPPNQHHTVGTGKDESEDTVSRQV